MTKDVSFNRTPPSQQGERAKEVVREALASEGTAPTPPTPMKRLTVDVPLSLHTRVKTRCVQDNTPISEVVRNFLEKKFPEDEI